MMSVSELQHTIKIERARSADSLSQGPSSYCRVGTLGLDERMCNALDFFFLRKLDGQFTLVPAEQADVLIVDLDTYGSRDLWAKQAQSRPGQPTILLSVQPVEANASTFVVHKPMKPQDLITALMDAAPQTRTEKARPPSTTFRETATSPSNPASSRLPEDPADQDGDAKPSLVSHVSTARINEEAAPVPSSASKAGLLLEKSQSHTFFGSAPDIDPDDPQALAGVQFVPDDHLIGKLRRAVELARANNSAVRIELNPESITVFPDSDKAWVNMHYTRLRGLAVISLADSDVTLRVVDGVDPDDAPPHQICRLEALLWTSALLASRGRVPIGTDLKAPIKLLRWPNLTRLGAIPHALQLDSSVRITSLLSREPISLVDAAEALKLPQRYLFAYFTSASALGLIDQRSQAGTDTSISSQKAPKPPRNRGLLKRILSHLRN